MLVKNKDAKYRCNFWIAAADVVIYVRDFELFVMYSLQCFSISIKNLNYISVRENSFWSCFRLQHIVEMLKWSIYGYFTFNCSIQSPWNGKVVTKRNRYVSVFKFKPLTLWYEIIFGVVLVHSYSCGFMSNFVTFHTTVRSVEVAMHCKCLQGITGSLQVFPVVGKPCNIYRLLKNPIIIMGFPRNL